MQIKFTFTDIVCKNIIVMSVLAVFATVVKRLYNFLLNQYVWLAVALIVFIICTAGTVFSLQNGMPLFKFGKNEFGAIVIQEYFMSG